MKLHLMALIGVLLGVSSPVAAQQRGQPATNQGEQRFKQSNAAQERVAAAMAIAKGPSQSTRLLASAYAPGALSVVPQDVIVAAALADGTTKTPRMLTTLTAISHAHTRETNAADINLSLQPHGWPMPILTAL